MHLYLILEIALLYGKDIDDEARVPEMAAVVAGTGVAVGAPFVADALGFHPLVAMATGGVAALTASRLIGESAIRYYSQPQEVASLHSSRTSRGRAVGPARPTWTQGSDELVENGLMIW